MLLRAVSSNIRTLDSSTSFQLKGSRQKKFAFLADMSAKAFSPPPMGPNGHVRKSFFMNKFQFRNKKFQKIPSSFPPPKKNYIS